ncbi:MAG: hypothetical protein NC911_02925 [Candidatus Omnitrophica bacterium]|nr:hypothetical protein [Candidatus Omnitrophota bacterium]MCM8768623.1 hypothetical protein [Candidatus Omnitrophota bacterium]
MSTVDKLISRVIEEATRESQEILAKAKEEAASLQAEKERQIENQFRQALSREKLAIQERYREKLAKERLAGQRRVLAERNKCLNEVLDEVKKLFHSWLEHHGPGFLSEVLAEIQAEGPWVVYVPAGKEAQFSAFIPVTVKPGKTEGFIVEGANWNLVINWETVQRYLRPKLVEIFRQTEMQVARNGGCG